MLVSCEYDDVLRTTADTFPVIADNQAGTGTRNEFYGAPGQQHYRFLHHLVKTLQPKSVVDIGTHQGASAIALASGAQTTTVHTFDIHNKRLDWGARECENRIVFHQDDLFDPQRFEANRALLLASPLIFLDVDPHNGVMEIAFYRMLRDAGYRGLLVCDDVWMFKGMRDHFWSQVELPKVDCTHVGHFSGTGIIVFGNDYVVRGPQGPRHAPAFPSSFSVVAVSTNKETTKDDTITSESKDEAVVSRETKEDDAAAMEATKEDDAAAMEATKEEVKKSKSWSVVTAYFDLTKRADASAEIKARNTAYYLQHANMTMSLDTPGVNLIVYADAASMPLLRALRPPHLLDRTQFCIVEFEDLEVVKGNAVKISEDRRIRGYNPDPRNTVSYYLLCMARYELLQDAMRRNPFASTHFAWCNICIERMDWRAGYVFPAVWGEFRDKFSTCYIDFIPKSRVDNAAWYWQFGRCSMCSGFFTGNLTYMSLFCERILEAFANATAAGVGHADEQLFSIVFFQDPSIFEVYFGDYQQMVTNYGWIRQAPDVPVRCLMSNLCQHATTLVEFRLLRRACERWLKSRDLGLFISDSEPRVVQMLIRRSRVRIRPRRTRMNPRKVGVAHELPTH